MKQRKANNPKQIVVFRGICDIPPSKFSPQQRGTGYSSYGNGVSYAQSFETAAEYAEMYEKYRGASLKSHDELNWFFNL